MGAAVVNVRAAQPVIATLSVAPNPASTIVGGTQPFIAVARFIHHFLPEDSPRRAELPRLEQGGHAALGVMEQRLTSHPFLVADSYTIADIALYAYTHVAHEGGFDLGRYPAISAWLKRVAAQPGHIRITD